MPLFPEVPDFAELGVDELAAFIEENGGIISQVAADPRAYVSQVEAEEGQTRADALLAQMNAAVEAQEQAKTAHVAAVAAAEAAEAEAVNVDEFAALAARASETPEAPAVETAEAEAVATAEVEEEEPEEPEAEQSDEATQGGEIVAGGQETPKKAAALVAPVVAGQAVPAPRQRRLSLVAAAPSGVGVPMGTEIDLRAAADMMIKQRRLMGDAPPGTSGERYPIAKADWRDEYPDERRFDPGNPQRDTALVAAAIDQEEIKRELRARQEGKSLTASGGLCAPVTPYYGLMEISQADRPVRAALPAFGADRGGINAARPASLGAITTAVGAITEAADAAGGTFATKTCQRIDCPSFVEVDVDTIYHCLEVGNLTSRTFPELVAQWTSLTMSAHARLAESRLLTGIDQAGTAVTAGDLGLGASAALLTQYLTAADGFRSRHRMDTQAVLRLLMPWWAVDLMVSDVIRTQFQRFDTNAARLTALLRTFNIEPSFYIDSASGRSQIFGTQSAGALNAFPSTVAAYMFPEGSFLYLDGGTLELGLVRDSVLNQTNDYQLFGETFENVAYIGVESLTLLSEVCDTGAVSAPVTVTHCGNYTFGT